MNKNKRAWLATKVMGWKIISNPDYYFTNPHKTNASFYKHDWKPHENIKQAMMLLEQFKVTNIELIELASGSWTCIVRLYPFGSFIAKDFQGDGKKISRAICEAVLATGYKG